MTQPHSCLAVFSHGKESVPLGTQIRALMQVAERLGAATLSVNYREHLAGVVHDQDAPGEAVEDREAVQLALSGLKAYVYAQPDGAWLQTLPETLKSEVNITSMHAFPGYPDADDEIQCEERRGHCVMWGSMHPNPWRIQFSQRNLLRWWAARREAIS